MVRRFASNWLHTADLAHHTEITLQGFPNYREYTLWLFVENQERKLRKTDNRSWTPAQPLYALFFLTTYTY